MEEYKKKYEMALERAKEELGSGCFNRGSIEYIFPELAESEDEKIRKEITELIMKPTWQTEKDFNRRKELVVWLEKQVSPDIVADAYLRGCNDTEEKLLEKQDEQKPVDKVEPKFKVGDWAVNHVGNIRQIIDIKDDCYYCIRIESSDTIENPWHGAISYVDEQWHKWSIDDAKNGDVLVCKGNIKGSNGIKYERICLFNNLDNAFFTLTKLSNFVGEEYNIDVNIDYPDNTFPATKEQRELLFKKMNKAGYTWDAEKKELIKNSYVPKFNVGDWCIDNEDSTIFQIVNILDNTYTYKTNEGKEYSCTYYSLENDARLWTIQDVKDGDVISNENMILIFKQFEDPDYKQYVIAYIGLDTVGHIQVTDGSWMLGIDNAKPATKEQRDLLFKKMNEAGYTWDAEKKKLNQINEEYNDEDYGIDGLYHAQTILERTLGEVDGYQSDDGILEHKCAISKVKKLYKKKIYWSEDDEDNMNILIDCVSQLEERDIYIADLMKKYNTVISWLEEIKERLK